MLDALAPLLRFVRLLDGTMRDLFATVGAGPGKLCDPHWSELQPEEMENRWMLVVLDRKATLRARISAPTGVRAVDLSEDGRFAVISCDDPETTLVRAAIPTP